MNKLSPNALPTSPVPSVTPAVESTADLRLVEFLSARISLLSTVTVFGVLSSFSGNLPEACSRSPL